MVSGPVFKSLTMLFVFNKVLILWRKVSIFLTWVNNRADLTLWSWYGNHLRRRKTLNWNRSSFYEVKGKFFVVSCCWEIMTLVTGFCFNVYLLFRERHTFRFNFILGIDDYFCGGNVSWSNRNGLSSQSRRLSNASTVNFWQIIILRTLHVYLCSVGMFHEQETQRTAKASGVSKHVCSPREKGMSILLRYVRGIEKKFFFSARKSVFLGIRQFRFLSEASGKTVILYLFILFYVYFILCYWFFFLIYITHSTLLLKIDLVSYFARADGLLNEYTLAIFDLIIIPFLQFFIWIFIFDLGLKDGLPDHWQALYSLGHLPCEVVVVIYLPPPTVTDRMWYKVNF